MRFIAEIGLNHNGNLDLALEMMRQAKNAGTDIVKMQLGWKGSGGEINHISDAQLDKLYAYADFLDIELLFSVFDWNSYDRLSLKRNVKRFKIASRTLQDNYGLASTIVRDAEESIVSLGMWDKDSLPFDSDKVKYLWCKSVYPSMPWDMHDLPKDFSNSPYSGYSDHTLGISVPLLAISRGAEIIEKHFTLDKSDTTIRDHVLSVTPTEFAQMVQIGREIYKNLQHGV